MHRVAFLLAVALGAHPAAYAETGPYWLRSPALTPATDPAVLTQDVVDGRLFLYAGNGGSSIDGTYTPANSTWTYDGSAWTRQQPLASPPHRVWTTLAHDAARDEVVLFGGRGSASRTLADTWVWDGATWTQRFPATSPPARSRAAMAYDAARQVVLLFGGIGAGGYFNDLWAWDGSDWTQLPTPPVAPSRRAEAAMTYDGVRQRVVLFGGEDGRPLGDTWFWDGTTWSGRDERPGLAPRRAAMLAANPSTGTVVLFGGRGDNVPWYSDTWVDSGTGWVRAVTPVEPDGRHAGGFTYFAAAGRFVLAAGSRYIGVSFYGGALLPLDTWYFDHLEG